LDKLLRMAMVGRTQMESALGRAAVRLNVSFIKAR